MQLEKPKTKKEFCSMMEQIDQWFKNKDVPIHARPLRAVFEISKRLDLNLNLIPRDTTPPAAGVYDGDDLSLRILNWFDDRYGKKTQIHFGPGKSVILIRDDFFEMVFPKVWGQVNFFVSSVQSSSDLSQDLKKNRVPKFNILDSITDMTPGLRRSLSTSELNHIFSKYVSAYKLMETIYSSEHLTMIDEIKSDIKAAVHYLLIRPPHFGQSKWASLQAAEKAIKSHLKMNNVKPKFTHVITKLADELKKNGLIYPGTTDLNAVSCSASVRYGEEPVSKQQAYDAHHSSLRICGLFSRNSRQMSITSKKYPTN